MKKRLLALALTGAMAVTLLAGCAPSTSGTTPPPSPTGSTTPAPSASEPVKAAGQVYYQNFKPEQDTQWQELAAAYTAETGVPVKVHTAAAGQYETTLMSEIAKTDAPTLFQVNGPVGLNNWKDYCYDLTGSKLAGELTSDDFALMDGDKIAGIAYVIESYGLITNKTLLQKAGYTVDDIKSFADLTKVAEDITARSGELGFSAFSSAGMDGTSDWRFKTHLANLPLYFEYETEGMTPGSIKGTYLDNYKNVWDLYTNNSTCSPKELSAKTGDDSRNEFLAGEAVFFQNGSWEYGNVTGEGKFTDADLAMIPIYIGVGDEANQGLCTGTENYWCVNSEAKPEDIQATLDFMYWCVTSETGTKAMGGGEGAMPSGGDGMNFVIPFKKAIESSNLFVKQDKEMTAAGKTPVSWNFPTMPSEEWKNGVGSALTAYSAGTGDWAGVVKAYVDGWAAEYAMVNG